ncbi:uncharacterized protein LOC110272994 [Arachis duranensis]|uniref:Uncharacterized protein LOC110272994 n=1 Tax=Arachis duranensis TaxID=130453 RepID=A0A6P5M877_ARADU|nr:uncharacterized protein LOC110272994 [Arachis duranensis]
MPLYAKFMKELLTNKRNWKESEIMMLTKECSAIIQKDLLEKMQDPGSFLIPYTIGDITIQRALCDIIANDVNASTILGRSFLATKRAHIDVQKGELTLRVNDEQVVLNVLEALQHPSDSERYMRVNFIEPLI